MARDTEADPLLRVIGRLIGRIQYDAMVLAANPEPKAPRDLALDIAANAQCAWRLMGYTDADMAEELLRQRELAERES